MQKLTNLLAIGTVLLGGLSLTATTVDARAEMECCNAEDESATCCGDGNCVPSESGCEIEPIE